jgi:hypothetical protein
MGDGRMSQELPANVAVTLLEVKLNGSPRVLRLLFALWDHRHKRVRPAKFLAKETGVVLTKS